MNEPSFFQRHFLLSAFLGTFLTAVFLLTAFFVWLGNANAAFAAVMLQCRSVVAGAKPTVQAEARSEERYVQAVSEALLQFNRYNGQMLDGDKRLEEGLTDWRQGSLTMEGLEMIAVSNCEELEKLKTKLKDYNLPSELKAVDRSRFKEAGDFLAKRLERSLYRQKHFSRITGDLKLGKLKNYQGLYLEDTLKYMRLIKELEYEYKLVYRYGGYKKGLKLTSPDSLDWVLLAQRGKAAEAAGEIEQASEIYTTMTRQDDIHSRGAGFMLLAGLKKHQGDYTAYQEFLQSADQYWPGASEDSGEYGACRRQGLI